MKNNVFGTYGLHANYANPNSDFFGLPRQSESGFFVTPESIKFAIRQYWARTGQLVFAMKAKRKTEKGDFQVCTQEQRYEALFGTATTDEESIRCLLSCVDYANFGFVYTGKRYSSATGVVQLDVPQNRWATRNETLQLLTPFAAKEGKEATLARRCLVDEAMYIGSFSVMPAVRQQEWPDFPYSQEAYLAFRKGLLRGIDGWRTSSKAGLSLAFAVFVEMQEGQDILLSRLSRYVTVRQNQEFDQKPVIDFSMLFHVASQVSNHIRCITCYVNPFLYEVQGDWRQLQVEWYSLIGEGSIN